MCDVVAAVLVNAGRFLMQLRDDVEGVASRGKWSLFGGHRNYGETEREAILRELREELGFWLS